LELALAGPVGRLVAEVEEPTSPPRGVALVCHPHPLHGGSLRNTIVVRTARALRSLGFVTLRLNFRGVEGSEGVHDGTAEVEDAAAAARWLQEQHPGLPLWAAGYSFGSRVVAELAQRDVGVERVFLIAFPCRKYSAAALATLPVPGLILLGGEDEFGTAADLDRALPRPPAGLERVELPGADHFFRGQTPRVESAVLAHAQRALST